MQIARVGCLLFATASAHPNLGATLCDDQAHPTTQKEAHGAPVDDDAFVLSLFEATDANSQILPEDQTPSNWESDNEDLRLSASDEVVPGADYMLLIANHNGQPFETLITSSAGVFAYGLFLLLS